MRASGWLIALALGLSACGSVIDKGGGGAGSGGDDDVDELRGNVSAALLRAETCDDLLTKIQDDAIVKLDLAIVTYQRDLASGGGQGAGGRDVAVSDGAESGVDDSGGGTSGSAEPVGGGSGPTFNGGAADGDAVAAPRDEGESAGGVSEPTGSSGTNTQVKDVDEADFVKVVRKGERIFLLNGAQLFALDSWPASETALRGKPLLIEGSPSEMFVTEDGKRAVIFSSVYGYSSGGYGGGGYGGGTSPAIAEDGCYDCSYGGGSHTKVTLADVGADGPKVVRELYFEGSYISSRRYGDVVRGVVQGYSRYQGLYYPDVEGYDPWGRPYEAEVLGEQLAAWRDRTAAAIRATKLADWVPVALEAVAGKLEAVEPDCKNYYVPHAGLSDYGLTHVFSLDIGKSDAALGGVTIMGATSTVYSNAERLILAQPDYRAFQSDFGFVNGQQTALHMFELDGAATRYAASGWVPGELSYANPQFGIDEQDGTIRLATTGWVRTNPQAGEDSPDFWEREPRNLVVVAAANDEAIEVVGKTDNLGHEGETIRSARFLGERAYVVTFRQTDPLIVVSTKEPKAPKVLGEVEIPGFSEYIHPLDEDHLITLGQSGSWGIQLQLFDVSDATAPKRTSTLDFGSGTYSEGSYSHKAFTYYAAEKLLAVPVSGNYWDEVNGRYGFSAGVQVVRVDADAGLSLLGSVDHSSLYQKQSCGVCDEHGCYDFHCGYGPDARRGHFVSGDDSTFVYSFSTAGVLVNDLGDLDSPVASVVLPEIQYSSGPFYSSAGGKEDAEASGSSSGSAGVEISEPSADADADAGAAEPVDESVLD